MASEKALRYAGGGSLSFRDGAGARRHVLGGASFLVDAATARILLEDPAVTEGDVDDVPRENTALQVPRDQGRAPLAEETPQQIDVAKATKPELLAYAKLLGLTIATKTTIDKVRARIEKELKRRQAMTAPLADPTSTAANTDQPVPFADVKARAIELGLKVVGVNRPAIEAAIAAEDERLAEEAAAAQASSSGGSDQGGSTSADDPDAGSSGEADTPPSSNTGAVTLGDLPESAKATKA